MTTAYTSLLGFALPVTGELNGTWGDVVNNSITQLVEDSVAGQATASVTSGDWTLTTTGSGAANQARCAILIPTGTPGVSRNIIAPSSSKAYIVINQSDAAVVLKGAATTGVTIAAGTKVLAAWNGTDFVQVGSSGTVTAVSVATANGLAGTSSGGATPSLTLSTTVTGIVKGNGTALSAASAGTDYAPATSGTSILYGNGSGGFSNVTIGTGVSFAGGTLSATGSGGTVTSVTGTSPIVSSGGTTPAISIPAANGTTNGYLTSSDWTTFNSKQPAGTYVTSVSVASANGFTGTSSGGATPALTLATSVTGMLKGNGTAISAGTAGTDYLAPPSGTAILKANSGGALANATANTDYLAPALANTAVTGFKTATFNSQTTIATTTGAITVDWTTAQNQKQTEPTGTITYTFTAPPGPCHLQLIIDSDGTSTAQTINWPGTVVWMGATWAGANNKKAVINFWYDGSSYFAVGTNQV